MLCFVLPMLNFTRISTHSCCRAVRPWKIPAGRVVSSFPLISLQEWELTQIRGIAWSQNNGTVPNSCSRTSHISRRREIADDEANVPKVFTVLGSKCLIELLRRLDEKPLIPCNKPVNGPNSGFPQPSPYSCSAHYKPRSYSCSSDVNPSKTPSSNVVIMFESSHLSVTVHRGRKVLFEG